MFKTFIDNTIDQVVVAKKAVIDVTTTHKEVKQICNQFVDTQAKYTREAIHAGTDMVTKLVEVATDRTPYVELQKQFEKFFPVNSFASKKAK
jgi:CMP-2-keto-3-deoxyoctulosonic acid synthetase